MSSAWILSWILFLPLAGALAVFVLPERVARPLALGVAVADFILSLHLPVHFNGSQAGLQFVESHAWIPALGIRVGLGIDGISLWLVMLTTFLAPLTIFSAWESIEKHRQAFFALLLILQTAMLGALLATDLFLFYIFWEAMLIPMYLLIGVWGGKRRIYATVKFFIYTMSGSLFMLAGMIALLLAYKEQFGGYTGDIATLARMKLSPTVQIALFSAFAISFAIKIPVFLLHTWLPDAHVEAPTAGSVILAGILLKMGGYGFFRLALPLFPVGFKFTAPLFLSLAVLGIIYGALVAMVQRDIKKLVAYSSVSHLGFVVLGLFVLNLQGMTGSYYQMLSHGLSTGGLFLIVGMLYDRLHTREIADYGGLAKSVPLLSVFFMIVTFASIGVPGLNGFVGEFLVLLGAYRFTPLLAGLAGSAVILGAIYMLWMFQRVVFGPVHEKCRSIPDLSWRETVILTILCIAIFWTGLYPKPILRTVEPAMQRLLTQVGGNGGAKGDSEVAAK